MYKNYSTMKKRETNFKNYIQHFHYPISIFQSTGSSSREVKNPHATLEAGVAEADPRPLTLKAVGFEA